MTADNVDAVQVTMRASKVNRSAAMAIGDSRVSAGIEELLHDDGVATGASPVQRS